MFLSTFSSPPPLLLFFFPSFCPSYSFSQHFILFSSHTHFYPLFHCDLYLFLDISLLSDPLSSRVDPNARSPYPQKKNQKYYKLCLLPPPPPVFPFFSISLRRLLRRTEICTADLILLLSIKAFGSSQIFFLLFDNKDTDSQSIDHRSVSGCGAGQNVVFSESYQKAVINTHVGRQGPPSCLWRRSDSPENRFSGVILQRRHLNIL